jgi:serine protease Do
MSHQIVECPGCLSKLRVREAPTTITLHCPRCGEYLSVEPPERPSAPPPPAAAVPRSAPARPVPTAEPKSIAPQKSSAATSPSRSATSRPTPKSSAPSATRKSPPKSKPPGKSRSAYDAQDDPWGTDDYEDSYTSPPARNRTQPRRQPSSGKGAFFWVGMSIVVMALVGGAWMFFGSGDESSSGIQPLASSDPPVFGSPDPSQSGFPAAAPSGLTPNPPLAQATPPGTGFGSPAPNSGAAAGNPGAGAFASAAISSNQRKLRYQWKPGAEHIYQFTIEVGPEDDVTRTTGSCTYRVAGAQNTPTTEEEGSGTGFVVSANGILATCAHVVEGAKRIEVQLGGQTYPAQIISMDPRTDVALIRVNASGLPVLPLADSESVQLAEEVRAIGFPLSDVLGTGVKVTTGTVAGIVQDRDHGKRIQIDAAINPGNSGGPVVNGAGQVIGIASAKLSGSSVTSVGFAAPVNQLRTLAAAQSVTLGTAAAAQDLAGPEVARRVTPSVAYIRVWGSSGGQVHELSFAASFSESAVASRGRIPRMPSFGNFSNDSGKVMVNALGEVLEFNGEAQLPGVLGPVGVFFLEPLDAYSESQWQVENEQTLTRIKRDEGPFGGRMGPGFGPRMRGPRGFGPPGFGPPGFGQPQEEVLEEIPAVERVMYSAGQTLNDRISLSKKYEFSAIRSNNQPYMNIRGEGTLVFDMTQGMPASLDYRATIEQNDTNASVRIPLHVTYTLRNPEEVKQEREALAKKAEEDRKRAEEERSTPNPMLVDELIADIRKAEGGGGASAPLARLAKIAVVEEKRSEILRIVKNHMKNTDGFVRKSATEAFCHWATKSDADELAELVTGKDGLLFEARKTALQTLGQFKDPKYIPTLIQATKEGSLRDAAKDALIAFGPEAEQAIIEGFGGLQDSTAQSACLDVIKKIGTEKSVPFLEQLTSGGNASVKHNAEQALNAIRSRL